MSQMKKLAHLIELEEALRDDADVMRARHGGPNTRLNPDDAADAVAELRAILEDQR